MLVPMGASFPWWVILLVVLALLAGIGLMVVGRRGADAAVERDAREHGEIPDPDDPRR